MTLPFERYYALINTRNFMRDLLDPSKTKRVPRQIRKEAYWCLKHFPTEMDIEQLATACPEVVEIVGKEKK